MTSYIEPRCMPQCLKAQPQPGAKVVFSALSTLPQLVLEGKALASAYCRGLALRKASSRFPEDITTAQQHNSRAANRTLSRLFHGHPACRGFLASMPAVICLFFCRR